MHWPARPRRETAASHLQVTRESGDHDEAIDSDPAWSARARATDPETAADTRRKEGQSGYDNSSALSDRAQIWLIGASAAGRNELPLGAPDGRSRSSRAGSRAGRRVARPVKMPGVSGQDSLSVPPGGGSSSGLIPGITRTPGSAGSPCGSHAPAPVPRRWHRPGSPAAARRPLPARGRYRSATRSRPGPRSGPGHRGEHTAHPGRPANSLRWTPWSAAIISAALSPIMIEAALVLPLVIFGITLASATRRSATPITRKRGSTTLPMRQVPVRWYTVNE
jgi:hypothetical protein